MKSNRPPNMNAPAAKPNWWLLGLSILVWLIATPIAWAALPALRAKLWAAKNLEALKAH